MIKVKIGNILDAEEDIIVHQVNIQGYMGGGLAKQIASQYPEIEKDYEKFCRYYNNDYSKLRGAILLSTEDDFTVCNMFSQKPNFDTDYEAMEIALKTLKKHCREFHLSIAIPYGIGCGIANGDWDIVYKIIEKVFNDYDVILYKLEARNE